MHVHGCELMCRRWCSWGFPLPETSTCLEQAQQLWGLTGPSQEMVGWQNSCYWRKAAIKSLDCGQVDFTLLNVNFVSVSITYQCASHISVHVPKRFHLTNHRQDSPAVRSKLNTNYQNWLNPLVVGLYIFELTHSKPWEMRPLPWDCGITHETMSLK